ncbi:hypothetical protein CDEST_14793 [Colletotrichum destructivum]|uniref:Uncharacterized protein n=1 Tax=Colletotrichum destructivum TaxID=34406 RepID=A0AAX4J2X3_9PEZI|nr:hypothetical protein CDEST_14793 [Colletotrichum destructivum]
MGLVRHHALLSRTRLFVKKDVDPSLISTTEAVKRWLEEASNDGWLVVYNNYDHVRFKGRRHGTNQSVQPAAKSAAVSSRENEPEAADPMAYDIRPYLPKADHGAVIITTRSSTVKLGQFIRLRKLGDINDSLAILESTSNRVHLSQGKSVAKTRRRRRSMNLDALALARRLDGLPLALSTAGAYLNQVSTTYAKYLQLYDNSWLRLQRESPQLLDYDQALYSTWEVSFRHIQQENQSAATLLQLWAYLDNEDVWYELLREGALEGLVWLQEMTKDEINFDAAMRVLCEHGLVEAYSPTKESGIESQGYSVHGCVHLWMIHVLNTRVDEEEMAWIAMRCVAS